MSDKSNKKSGLSKPHDRLFKRSMQEQKIAIDLLQSKLPPALLAEMDLSTLTLVNNDHILDGLELLESDCVCRCRIRGEDGYIIIGVEHQSQDDELMALRNLRYEVGIMYNHTRNGNKKLPIVVSIVVYHGTKSPYPHSTEIWDCFEQPELAKQWALKPFHLIDLTVMTDEQIQQFHSAAMMGLLFKHYREERFAWLQKMLKDGVFAIILAEIGKDYLASSGEYIFKACRGGLSPEERDKALSVFNRIDPEVGEKIMTLAEHFKAVGAREARQEGHQQGGHDKACEIAKKMLEARVDLQTIKNCTGLSEQEISRLH